MQTPPPGHDQRGHRYDERRGQRKAAVTVFDIDGETVSSVTHACLVVSRTRDYLRLVSEEPLPVGERVDITFDPSDAESSSTCAGVPRHLTTVQGSSGFLVDVELVSGHAPPWKRRLH